MVGISLLTLWSLGNSSTAVMGVCVLVVIDCGMGLTTLTKTTALYPLLAFMIGFLSFRLTLPRLFAACLFMWVSYGLLIEPWVTSARTEISIMHRNHMASSLSERVEALSRYFFDQKKEGAPERLQTGFIRMSYTNSAAFVISQYDRGLPGNSLRDSLYSFIPRFLWPEKPQFKVAGELATLATGTFGNSISAGYFAEAYWNLGWIGLPILMFPIGAFINVASHFAARVIARKDWIYLPLLFLNIKIGMSVTEWYVGFIGTIAQGIVLFFMLKLSGQWLRGMRLLPPLELKA